MESTADTTASKEICKTHLQDIERPEYMGKRVRIPLVVAGVGRTYSIPSEVEARCLGKKLGGACFPGRKVVKLAGSPAFWLKCVGKRDDLVQGFVKEQASRTTGCDHIEVGMPRAFQTVTELAVYPNYQELEYDVETGRAVDELGRDWKRVDVVYLGSVDSKSKPYIAEGIVVAHPQTQEITVVVERLERVDAEDEELEAVPLSYGDLEELISKLERYTTIKGRRDAHLLTLLLYETPQQFLFDGELVEGWGKGLFFGDTTTGKSKTAKAIRRLLRKGKYVVAETASRAGLLYGVEQVGGSRRVVIWGHLPQADGGLLIVDGTNKLPPQEWGEFLEAIRTGMLTVSKIVGGQHPCRTRVLLLGNPGNPPKYLATYPRRADAVTGMFSEPFIARLDVALSFGEHDVSIDEINRPNSPLSAEEQNILAKTLRANVSRAWRARPEELGFDAEAKARILRAATELYREFKDSRVPVASNDLKHKLARETISLALLCGRTKATVEDVEYIVQEFRQVCTSLGLGAGDSAEEASPQLIERVATERQKDVVFDALVERLVAGGEYTQQGWADTLGKDPRTVKERLEALRTGKLVQERKQKWAATPLLHKVVKEAEMVKV